MVRSGEQTGMGAVVGEEVGAYPGREEHCEVACAEEGVGIDTLDTPLAELIPG